MHIQNDAPGRRYAPLDEIEVVGAEGGTLIVSDGARRVYLRASARASLRFTVGGAAGRHTILHVTDDNRLIDRAYFTVVAETGIRDVGGEFADLFDQAYVALMQRPATQPIRWKGKLYRAAAENLRAFADVLPAQRYFEAQLVGAVNLFSDSQRASGMIWSDVYPFLAVGRVDSELFHRFQDGSGCFCRDPKEVLTEAMFVESVYHVWQATGDDSWLAYTADAVIRALDYSLTDAERWSQTFGLLRGGYPIAGVDAAVLGAGEPAAPDGAAGGILPGDNTRYIAACRRAAAMLAHLGRAAEAIRLRDRAEAMEQRLIEVAWDGDYYYYYVPEQYGLAYDVGVDEDSQVAIANAEALAQGVPHAQSAAILRTYQRLAQRLPEGSPGEWHTIIPPFLRGSDDDPWQGQNGAASTAGAAALALGALSHGFEPYGADVLRRVAGLSGHHGGELVAQQLGRAVPPISGGFSTLDMDLMRNIRLEDYGLLVEAVDVAGEQLDVAGVPFQVAPGDPLAALGLRRAEGYVSEASLTVGGAAATIYLLHTLVEPSRSRVAGVVTLHYADGSEHSEYVLADVNVCSWQLPVLPYESGPRRLAPAWAEGAQHGALVYAMDNPHPLRPIDQINFRASEDGALWGVLAVTVGERPAAFPADAETGGSEGQRAASAVLTALTEGLAGITDGAAAFERARIAPRWLAAEVDEAEVTVVYPASGGYVAYRYEHDMANRQILLLATGSGARASFHVLLPPYAQRVSVVAGDADVPHTIEAVEGSRYADFEVDMLGAVAVTVAY